MAAEQRKLLEQLMGASTSRQAQVSMDDPKVCRSYIVGTCPHDLFTNTKQDFGPCSKIHSEGLKAEYEAMPERDRQRLGFEYDYMRDLHKYIDDCNRRIDSAQKRLEKTPEEIRQTNDLLEAIADIDENIKCGVEEIEVFVRIGQVNLAMDEWHNLKVMAQTKTEKERELKALSDTSGPSGHQKLQVCDVCGAYLSRLDNDRRLADHFYGKMHLGYAQMRKAYEAFPREMRQRARQQPPMDDDGPGGPRGPKGPRGYGGYGGGRRHRG
ncbi:u1 snrnp splicing complex subunit [Purpureocillium lilacinum]|uniref:U1 snrnp splicing complex subunit n=1 Tax=Purpureocillium lilacinum TaxID=33203 RepID=A0A179GYP3_PURLI|nr:u1 snrnp splicing complex subunit [Purpureocillium lilacinum]